MGTLHWILFDNSLLGKRALTVLPASFLLLNACVLTTDFSPVSRVEADSTFANRHLSPTSLFLVLTVVRYANLT